MFILETVLAEHGVTRALQQRVLPDTLIAGLLLLET